MSKDLFGIQEEKNRSLRIRRGKKHTLIEVGMVEPDIKDERAKDYAKTDGYLGNIFMPKRFSIAYVFIFLFLILLLSRSAQLQIVKGAEYKSMSDSNRIRAEFVRADRGLIYDRYQIPLVHNIPNYIVTVRARELPADEDERKSIIESLYNKYFIHYSDKTLHGFINDIEELYANKDKKDKNVVIASFLKHDDAILLQIDTQRIPGLYIELLSQREYMNEGPAKVDPDDTRVYPPVKSISHLLGYLTPLQEGEYDALSEDGYLYNDVIGRTGLEAQYETELRGDFGIKRVEVDATGNTKQILNQEAATDGLSVLTALDVEFQRAIEDILRTNLAEMEKPPTKGTVVVLNPQNGEILALVSIPTYDNNKFAKGIDPALYEQLLSDPDNPLFNRTIAGEYPSGSTFKPIVAAAAFQEGIINLNTSFLSTGGIRIKEWFFPDWRAGGHGQTNIYHAIEDSVNTYFYTIGGGYGNFEGLGVAKISKYAGDFGLAESSGIDLPGEKNGFLPSKQWKELNKGERWYIGDTYHLSIGQGDLLVTPLQMASAYSVFANGGTLYQPHLAKAFVDKDQNIISEIEPTVIREGFIDYEYLDIIQTGLRRVVTQGSGQRLYDLPIEVSGKTGTAQWHSEKDPHAWFAGYAPTTNPQIAFSILVEEGEEGSKIAVTITKQILSWWAANRL